MKTDPILQKLAAIKGKATTAVHKKPEDAVRDLSDAIASLCDLLTERRREESTTTVGPTVSTTPKRGW